MDVHIEITGDMGMSKEDLRTYFEKEIEDFSKWMEGIPDFRKQGALMLPERALLMTYLLNKYNGNIDAKRYT